MQAVVIDKPGDVGVGEVPDPSPGPEDVLVAVRACGICGTDVHIVDGEYSPARYPVIPGHEFAGEVVAVGREVTGISIGAIVTADPNNPCENPWGCGVSVAGACADYVVVRSWQARVLPGDFDVSVGALVEPLSCAVHGYDLVRANLGDRFLIYGAGTMGLLLVALAARVGAISVSVVEPNAARCDLARSLGATRVFASSQPFDGESFDLVIDATGVVGAIEDGLSRLKRGGTYLQFGVAPAEALASFSPYRLYSDELTRHSRQRGHRALEACQRYSSPRLVR